MKTRIFETSNLLFVGFLVAFIWSCGDTVPGSEQDQLLDKLENQIGDLSFSPIGMSEILYKKNHSIVGAVICSNLPDSLKKSTLVLFKGDLVQTSSQKCIKNFSAIDLCNNPQLRPGFSTSIHPLCFKNLENFPTAPPDLLIKDSNDLNQAMNEYQFEIISQFNFNTHHLIIFQAGFGSIDWEREVEYECNESTKVCTFKQVIKEWGNESVYFTGRFVYAMPKVQEGFTLSVIKENRKMN